MKEKILNNRFKLHYVDDEHFLMYLDDKILSKEYELEYGFTSYYENDLIRTHCNLSDIGNLRFSDIPEDIIFSFVSNHGGDIDDREADLTSNITLAKMTRENTSLLFEFWVSFNLLEYKGEKNPIKFIDEFLNLMKSNEIIELYNTIEDTYKSIGFIYKFNVENKNISLQNISSKIIRQVLSQFDKCEQQFSSHNFKAIFNLSEQYQSILKPYLQYFEEFLNDLCIESDVNVQRVGEDTILSVEPKNKDEALEKIADALKAYLCAPVMVESVSLEQTLQMQTELSKLYAQCKNLESQMIYKEITLKEQNKQLELNDNIINESKRVLVDAGVDTNIITQSNTILLESLKSIKIKNKETDKKTFLSSIKAKINVPEIFNGSLELKRDKY